MHCKKCPAHQQTAAALTALTDEHRAAKQKEMVVACRGQQLDIKIEKKKHAVDSLEATCRDLSKFIQHLQTLLQNTSKQVQDAKPELAQFQTERSEVVEGVRPQRSRTITRSCCAEPCPSPMRSTDGGGQSGRADAPRFAGASGGRRMSEKAAHAQPTKQSQSVALAQRRSSSIITANVTSWCSGRLFVNLFSSSPQLAWQWHFWRSGCRHSVSHWCHPASRHCEDDPHREDCCGTRRCVCAAWMHTDWTVPFLRSGVRRPERGIAGSCGAAEGPWIIAATGR